MAGVSTRQNFSWGSAGQGVEGVDYGNTNNWTDQQWRDYEKRYGLTYQPQPTQQVEENGGYLADGQTPAGAQTITGQAKAASTYSNTPGAPPAQNTTNQGTQDVVRNSYLERATQGTAIDPNDPNIKQQLDPYAAAQERAKRDYVSGQAEKLSAQGLGSSGAMQQEERYAAERAGQSTGAFHSQLVQQELQNRRNEINDALKSLGGMLSADQANQLQRDLADLDAAIKRESLAQSGSLGGRELDIKDRLGTAANNIDLLKALLQNQQYGQGQALDWANFDWSTSPLNPRNSWF